MKSKTYSYHLLIILLIFSLLGCVSTNINDRLIDASMEGDHIEVIKSLSEGANPNAKGRKEQTALMVAAANGHANIVVKLIEAGADVNATDSNVGVTPLSLASLNGHEKVVTTLLKGGANVDQKDKRGFTPLNIATEQSNFAIVKQLVKHGADVNNQGSTGATPLMAAAYGGQTEIVKFLLNNGADPHIKSPYGTASDYARSQKRLETFKILRDAERKK